MTTLKQLFKSRRIQQNRERERRWRKSIALRRKLGKSH